jgi:hypothetical protein
MSRINVANFRHPDATADSITVTSDGDTQINRALGLGGATYGTSGQVLTSAGSGAVPTWTTPTSLSNAEDGAGTDFEFNSGFGSNATAYGCRAWVNFNGTGTVAIQNDGNVSSITDLNVGQYRVNFSNSMPDSNYCVTGSVIGSLGSTNPYTNAWVTTNENASNISTGYVEVRVCHTTAGNQDHSQVNVAVFR